MCVFACCALFVCVYDSVCYQCALVCLRVDVFVRVWLCVCVHEFVVVFVRVYVYLCVCVC